MNVENACLLTGILRQSESSSYILGGPRHIHPQTILPTYTPTRSLSECDDVKSNVKQGVKAILVKCDEGGKGKTICCEFNHGA